MPKSYPKTPPKKTQPKKNKPKAQMKTPSLFKNKYYWITLALIILVFTVAYGYSAKISVEKELLILGSVFSLIGLAFYIGFKPSENYSKRIIFFLAGASIIGFIIWAVMVLLFNAVGFTSKISSSVGEEFFAITSLIICLVLGSFIGDLIGKNKENIMSIAYELREKIRK